jgi:hypothetical protein
METRLICAMRKDKAVMLERVKRHKQEQYKLARWNLSYIIGIVGLCSFLLLLSACTNPFMTPAQTGSASATPDLSDYVTPTPSPSPTPAYKPPTITLQVSGPCPSLKWDSLVGTRANVNKVQTVTCGSLEGSGSLDALMGVRYYSPGAKLDIYVYDNLNGTPTQRFKLPGLLNGNAVISPTGTIMTAELGPHGFATSGQNVYREFQWNASTGSFGQILFNGIYPDVTHYQAEQAQANFTNSGGSTGSYSWEASGTDLAQRLATQIFHWQSVNKVVVKNNKVDPIVVQIDNLGPGGGGFTATMYHLDGNYNNILEITSITTLNGSNVLSSPTANAQLSSPVKVSGTYSASSGILGRVVLYDDMYTLVGDTGPIKGSTTSGTATFTPSVSYHLSSSGLQEGVLAFYSSNQNNANLTSQVAMIKVFLSA